MTPAKKFIDPKTIGVPNICFSLTKYDDEREEDFREQRIKRGFDDSETWSIPDTFVAFMIPRLKRYVEITKDISVGSKEECEQIKHVIRAFELIGRDEGSRNYDIEEEDEIERGLEIFSEDFMSWWW